MNRSMLLLGLALAAGNSAAAEFDFGTYTAQETGSWADAVAAGDINGDGLDDVVLATDGYFDGADDFHIFVYLQQPDGTLSAPAKYRYAEYSQDPDVEIADMDNDGIGDVLIGHGFGLTLFKGRSSGVLSPLVLSTERSCMYLASADLDMDGNRDVVCQSWSNDAIVYYGNGLGGIRDTSELDTGANGYDDIKLGDVTGDGLPDLVVTSAQSDSISINPHNGRGLGAPLAYPAPDTLWSPTANAIGDFNGDGRNDLAVSVSGNVPNSGVWLYLQQSSGRLGIPVRMASHDLPESMIATDLDGNGRMDLLVTHSGWNAIGRYMQSSSGLLAEKLTPAPTDGFGNQFAIGDINDDGCTDALFADHNAGLVTVLGQNCALSIRRASLADDFNGDGRSDLFWRNTASGGNAIWRSANFATPQPVTAVTNTAWSVIGAGDFNGDKKADLLWHNPATGTNAIWRSANQATPQPVTQITDPLWKIVGVGDFDGDGKHDLLWRHDDSGRNAIWKSANSATQASVIVLADTQWKVAGVGDFDADGRDDILWHNADTRQGMIWPAGDFWKKRSIMKVTNPAWTIAAVGDFDGDKHADILWRDTAGGVNAIWKQGYYTQQQAVTTLAGADWEVVATGDYDGDRKQDIAWRNKVTGENKIWLAASSGRLLDITDVTDPQWKVQP